MELGNNNYFLFTKRETRVISTRFVNILTSDKRQPQTEYVLKVHCATQIKLTQNILCGEIEEKNKFPNVVW